MKIRFNPRAPCGARLGETIYITAVFTFQSTRPMRGATRHGWLGLSTIGGFNPRAPCGARRTFVGDPSVIEQFQSTRPMRGAPPVFPEKPLTMRVSIHAPHAGRDPRRFATRKVGDVSIHAPHAGRDRDTQKRRCNKWVSIHAPHAGRDAGAIRHVTRHWVSIHAPHAGRDIPTSLVQCPIRCFNPRAPCGARLRPASC